MQEVNMMDALNQDELIELTPDEIRAILESEWDDDANLREWQLRQEQEGFLTEIPF